ncbi:DUF7146 domain-containing protein [Novosphingobium lindaniclasticum]
MHSAGVRPLAPSAHLAAVGARIVSALGGTWRDDRGVCRCPAHDDKVASLSIRVGTRSLLFKCFAGCETAAVLAALRSQRWVIPRLNDWQADDCRVSREIVRLECVRRLWRESRSLTGTIGEIYLNSRGIKVSAPALRFHPRCPIGKGPMVRFRPAIIAAVSRHDGICAVQRIFVEPDGFRLSRDLEVPKVSLGRMDDGAVRLSPAGPELGLAEGIETAMSATALLGIPVWATLGSSRLHAIDIPSSVRKLVLLADNDRAGHLAATRAQSVYARTGLEVVVEWPGDGLNDWNDVLEHKGCREGRGGR